MSFSNTFAAWDQHVNRTWILPTVGTSMRTRFDALLGAAGLRFPSSFIEIKPSMEAHTLIKQTNGLALGKVSMLKVMGWMDNAQEGKSPLPEVYVESGLVWLNDTRLPTQVQEVLAILTSKLVQECAVTV